jgi:hypothetical protein
MMPTRRDFLKAAARAILAVPAIAVAAKVAPAALPVQFEAVPYPPWIFIRDSWTTRKR